MISFRLSCEEYEQFLRVCHSRGLRNISEMIRCAVQDLIDQIGDHPALDIGTRLSQAEDRIQSLSLAVEHLAIAAGQSLDGRQSRPDSFMQATSGGG
jgi:hypothetical protein